MINSGIYVDDVDAGGSASPASAIPRTGVSGGVGRIHHAGAVPLVDPQHCRGTLGGDPQYAKEITRRIAAGNLSTEVTCAPATRTACWPA